MDFRGKRIFFNIIGAILATLMVVFGFFALVNVVFNITYIKTDVYQLSMFPTLNAGVKDGREQGDVVYVNRFAPVSRGDIVVADVTWNAKPIIKRLVACPGDSFYITEADGKFQLFVNEQLFYTREKSITYPQDGELLPGDTEGHCIAFQTLVEKYRQSGENGRIAKTAAGQDMIKLFANEYLLLGDNWADSEDSLTVLADGNANGYVKRSQIIGKVDMIVHKSENAYISLAKQMLKLVF